MKYRTKPVVIEAVSWNGRNQEEINAFCGTAAVWEMNEWGVRDVLMIQTMEGPLRAKVYDYIIKGVEGEFYPCKPGPFVQKYEPEEDEE